MTDSAAARPATVQRASGRFREPALKGIGASESDQRIRVIPPATRWLAGSTAVVCLAALTWGVFGSIPTRVTGRGVVLSDQEGNFSIAAIRSGPVVEILVKPGTRVVAGQPIAIIEQKLVLTQIENALAEVERLEANLELLRAANAAQIASSDEAAQRQLAAVEEQVTANEVRRARLHELVEAYRQLRAKGMISQSEFISRQEQYDLTVLDLANARARKVEIELAAATKRDALADLERQKQAEIDLKKAGVDRLRVEMEVGSFVRSPISGMMREIRLGRGSVAAAGAVVGTVGPDQQSYYQVMVLLRGKTRKRAAPGMEAHIVPDSIKKEEYGSMRGRVTAVSDEDVSVEHVEQIVHNNELTRNLFGGEPALLAYVELFPTKDNPSGFEWWSGSGPPYRITAGSVATAEIIVERVRPITLVVPALRKLLSIEG
ncbi:MAG: NHLP bacteriocin system secretion protein [Proteobacteria bacterium]|nr:NHLP bacteriocin system secretion protein [Pseudomonadota bacterium]